MVCERWCVTKMVCKRGCVKDGVWQSGVWKMVCVAKLCVKDGVSKMVGDKVVCERWCVKDGGWQSWVWKMVCERWCVTKMVCERGCVKAGATPATQNDRGYAIVPRLPHDLKVDVTKYVTKCHACHAEVPRRHGRHGRLNQDQARRPVPWVKRVPRKTTVDVRLCHACHVKSRGMSPSATPATQKWRGVTGVTGA